MVALLWQLFFVRCFHATVGAEATILLVLAVWLIYAGDRMLDAWRGAGTSARHEFYRRNWRIVMPVWVVLLGIGVWLAWADLPQELWTRGLLLTGGVAVYFGAVHGAPALVRGSKEAAVGVIFALGVSLTAWPMVETWVDVVAIAQFCALCWMNCLAIEDWERGSAARNAVILGSACVALVAVLLMPEYRPVIACAETVSALALVALDHYRLRLSPAAMRVLADVALLSPILFLHVAGRVA